MALFRSSSLFLLWSLGCTCALAQDPTVYQQPYDCVIYPSVVAELGSSVSGVLSEVRVDRSQRVKQGEVVAQLESGAERAALELIKARVQSNLEIEYRQESAAHKTRQVNRVNEAGTKDILSQEDLDLRQTDATIGKIQLAQAQENKRFLAIELEQAEELLSRRSIRSPFDGVVIEQMKYVGEFLDGEAVVKVARLDPLYIETILPASHMGMLSAGGQATVRLQSNDATEYKATVDRVDEVVDVASSTFGVRLSLPNPDYRITAGLRCSVQFEQAQPAPVAALPTAATDLRNSHAGKLASPGSRQAVSATLQSHQTATDEANEGVQLAAASRQIECPPEHPYSSREQAVSDLRKLARQGLDLQLEEKAVSVNKGYSVVSPVLDQPAELDAYVKALDGVGFDDWQLDASDGGQSRLQLGYFNEPDNALSRLEQVLRQGVLAEIVPWLEQRVEYWVRPVQGSDDAVADCVY